MRQSYIARFVAATCAALPVAAALMLARPTTPPSAIAEPTATLRPKAKAKPKTAPKRAGKRKQMPVVNYLLTSTILDTAATSDEANLKDGSAGTSAAINAGGYVVFDLGSPVVIHTIAAHADNTGDPLNFEAGNVWAAGDITDAVSLGTVYCSGGRNGTATGDATAYRYVRVLSPVGSNTVYELYAESPDSGGGVSPSSANMMSAMIRRHYTHH